jgi:hypothetical protein
VEGRKVVAQDLVDTVPALTVVLAKAAGARPTKRALAVEEVALRVLAQHEVGGTKR